MTAAAEPRKRRASRSKAVAWDAVRVQKVTRPQGKGGQARHVHPVQAQILESYAMGTLDGKPQAYALVVSTRSEIPRMIKELRRLAKRHVPELVLCSQVEGLKVWLWTVSKGVSVQVHVNDPGDPEVMTGHADDYAKAEPMDGPVR